MIDWLVQLKRRVEADYPEYAAASGKSFADPRSSEVLPESTTPHDGGSRYNVDAYAESGGTLTWMGDWSSSAAYKPGDVIMPRWGTKFIALKANIDVDPSSNRRGGAESYPGTWRPFFSQYLCSALSTKLAAKIGDAEPIGDYRQKLAAIKSVRKLEEATKRLEE
jgi:hypothetical protein